MRILFASILVATFAAPALASSDHDSPEEMAKAIVASLKAGDKAALERLLPGDDLLNKALTCKGDDDDVIDEVRETRRDLDKTLAKLSRKGLEFVRLETEKQREVKAGERIEDCTAKEALGWFEGEIEQAKDDDIDIELIRIADRWYLVDLDD